MEREVPFVLDDLSQMNLALREPDFTTAARIEDAINKALGQDVARMTDSGTVRLNLNSSKTSVARVIARIENLPVVPSRKARVVVDQRSGTIVLGADVKISRVAVSQGNLTIRVNETPIASQPNPFADGETLALPRTEIEIDENDQNRMAVVNENVTLADLVDGLNALGIGPRDMIDILQAIKSAGALHAELIVQ